MHRLLLAWTLTLTTLSLAAPARADLRWSPVVAANPQCATSIAVAPNDVPWITRCEPSDDKEVFYLADGFGRDPSCHELSCAAWVDDHGSGRFISTDLQGNVDVVRSDGSAWSALWDDENPTRPNGHWGELSPIAPQMRAYAPTDPGGCVTQFLDFADYPYLGFVTWTGPHYGWLLAAYFGLGCQAGADRPVYYWNPAYYGDVWHQVDAAHGFRATQLAFFTQSPPTGSIQDLWALTSKGHLYRLEGDHFVAMPEPLLAAPISMTDHFVIATGLFPIKSSKWTGVYHWDDDTQTWSYYVGLGTPDGHTIQQIAHASSFYAQNVLYGPSRLWGIDEAGNVYSLTDSGIPF
jgi:hypothetical protein